MQTNLLPLMVPECVKGIDIYEKAEGVVRNQDHIINFPDF